MKRVIRSKADIEQMLNAFCSFAPYDEAGQKHYFVFHDKFRGGEWTLMNTNGKWSVHGKGDTYCDPEERFLSTQELYRLIWKHRAAVNRAMKRLAENEVKQ